MNNELEKAVSRSHGETHPTKNLYWNSSAAKGKGDWRTIPKDGKIPGDDDATGKPKDLASVLKKTSDDDLIKYANKPGNAPHLRQMAYDELVKRGIDVSDIDMNSGKAGVMNKLFNAGSKTTTKTAAPTKSDNDDDDGVMFVDYNTIPDNAKATPATWKAAIAYYDGDTIDPLNPDFITSVFKGLKTKAQRIEFDKFVTDVKNNDPNTRTPDEQINFMNKTFARSLKSGVPFLIVSGGAGVGKTYNFEQVAKFCDLKKFNPATMEVEDEDYDWVEAEDVNSPQQLFELLEKYNGKTIVFDDADGIYKNASLNIMKKATNPGGDRLIGLKTDKGFKSFEFTGQIISLTNKTSGFLTDGDDKKAIYSRANKMEIYFTKEEQLQFIESRLHDMSFEHIKRLPNLADDIKEREEVFELLKNNFEKIDPNKFNARTLKDILDLKRGEEEAMESLSSKGTSASKLFGDGADWKKDALTELLKGKEDTLNNEPMTFQKAIEIFNL